MTSHIRVTHTGSLPRNAQLTQLLKGQVATRSARTAELRSAIVEAVQHVVSRQLSVGIDIVNDGEQPRVGFQTYLPNRMRGFGGKSDRRPPMDVVVFPAFAKHLAGILRLGTPDSAVPTPQQALDEISYEDTREIDEDCELLLQSLTSNARDRSSAFMTAPSPGLVATTMHNAYYETFETYLRALGREIRKEYKRIIDHGFILQIDAPDLAMEREMFYWDRSLSEFLEAAELHIEVLNESIAGLPRDRIRLHCCWGNTASPHLHDVELADLLPVLVRANVSAIGLAFGNPRHQHEASVLANRVPDHMSIVAGVIDVTTNYVEHPQVVANRLLQVIRAVGSPDRVLASPDCGFGTFAGYEWVAEDIVWEKFKTLRAGADLAARQL
jgi:5-methyltetrahydropteroyltriglutamate--homocysteine methyltransferase